MGAKIFGFLATLMLSVPLAAIGLMAVFGIPQLVPANGDTSSPRDKVIRGMRDAFNWGTGASEKEKRDQETLSLESAPAFGADLPGHSQGESPDDWRREKTEARVAANATSSGIFNVPSQRNLDSLQESGSRPAASPESAALRHWNDSTAMESDRRSQLAAVTGQRDVSEGAARQGLSPYPAQSPNMNRQPAAILNQQAPLLTWRQAALRLTELGVKNYHLERGAAEGTFLFVCTFSPGDAPHVVHRFEAEMDDPLLAVNQVLQQVDQWMQSRYAAANFPTKPQSISLGSR